MTVSDLREVNYSLLTPFSTAEQTVFLEEVAEILVKYHGSPDRALLDAAQAGDLDSVQKLLCYGANSQGTVAFGGWAYSLLDLACLSGNVNLTKYLMNDRTHSVTSTTFLSALWGKNPTEITQHLISCGHPWPQYVFFDFLLNHLGTTSDDLKAVQFLTENGVKYTIRDNPASPAGHLSAHIVNALFMRLYETFDKKCSENARQIINLLLPLGLLNQTKPELLVFIGSKINGQDTRFNSPLLAAISHNDIDLVKRLIAAGSDVNSVGRKYLAGIDTKYYTNISPSQLATSLGHKEILVILMSNGMKF